MNLSKKMAQMEDLIQIGIQNNYMIKFGVNMKKNQVEN